METMSVFLSVFRDGLSSRVIKKKKEACTERIILAPKKTTYGQVWNS